MIAAQNTNNLLELQEIHSFHGNIEALKGVSLSLKEGEIIALLGANGAGKTTTLSSIVGLITPRQGNIFFDGTNIVGRQTDSLVKQGLIMVPEGRHIFPALTVLENLKMGAYLREDKLGIQNDLRSVQNS
ncbi:MAG: ATP-binding cassette domain-containing protein [Deltaproteobacteria bacterium]|nr:ATP-binding cassette domain-containing protein [Deltaproteobacteria bacterium]